MRVGGFGGALNITVSARIIYVRMEEVELRLVLLLVLFVAGFLVGDELVLKDGRRLRGEVEKKEGFYLLRTRHGWVRVKASDVVAVMQGEPERGVIRQDAGKETSFDACFRRGRKLLAEGKIGKGRLELLGALRMRPHDVRVWLALGFVPTRDGWRFVSRKQDRQEKAKGAEEKARSGVPQGVRMDARRVVERGLSRLARRLQRKEQRREVFPVTAERSQRSLWGGGRWVFTPYGWAWMETPWRWVNWYGWGWPLYRGFRTRIVITGEDCGSSSNRGGFSGRIRR